MLANALRFKLPNLSLPLSASVGGVFGLGQQRSPRTIQKSLQRLVSPRQSDRWWNDVANDFEKVFTRAWFLGLHLGT